MSSSQIKKVSLLEASRHHSTPNATSLNTTDISLNNTNLESYKKALHNIVRRLNKTPTQSSTNNKSAIRRSETKLNKTQQAVYNTACATNSSTTNIQKHYITSGLSNANKAQPNPKRSQSNDGSAAYKGNRDLLNKSMQENCRKESLPLNVAKSISNNRSDKIDTCEIDDIGEEKVSRGEPQKTQESALNTTILHEVNLNTIDNGGDKSLRDLVHKYQLRDAMHRQEILKLKKANDMMRSHFQDLEKELEKVNQNREVDKKYINRLESENIQLKDKLRQESNKSPITTTITSDKENKYLKMIEDLKGQVASLSAEKKLVEHLLKNSLLQNDSSKENNIKLDKRYSVATTASMDNPKLLGISNKNLDVATRVKTDNYVKKTLDTEGNDENDYPTYAQFKALNTSVNATAAKGSVKEDRVLKEAKEASLSINFAKINMFLNEGSVSELHEDCEEAYPNKVVPPKLNTQSLKERMDMTQFRLDLTRISKNRKVD